MHHTIKKLINNLEDFKTEGYCSQGEISIINTKLNKLDEISNNLNYNKHNVILSKNIDYFNDYSNDIELFASSKRLSDLTIACYVKMINKGLIEETTELSLFEHNFEEILEKYGLIYLEPLQGELVKV